jgi:hypothetical protein
MAPDVTCGFHGWTWPKLTHDTSGPSGDPERNLIGNPKSAGYGASDEVRKSHPTVIASVSEAIHGAASANAELLRRKCSSQ